MAMSANPITIAIGEAHSGSSRFSKSQIKITGIINTGKSTPECTVAATKGKITPANMAADIWGGILATSLLRAGHAPVRTTSKLLTINAPTAVSKSTPSPELVARNAAPGVDQTMLTGILSHVLSRTDSTP